MLNNRKLPIFKSFEKCHPAQATQEQPAVESPGSGVGVSLLGCGRGRSRIPITHLLKLTKLSRLSPVPGKSVLQAPGQERVSAAAAGYKAKPVATPAGGAYRPRLSLPPSAGPGPPPARAPPAPGAFPGLLDKGCAAGRAGARSPETPGILHHRGEGDGGARVTWPPLAQAGVDWGRG